MGLRCLNEPRVVPKWAYGLNRAPKSHNGVGKSLNQNPQGGLENIGYTNSNGPSGTCCKVSNKYLIEHMLGGQNGKSTACF